MDVQTVMTWLEICGENDDCSGCCPYGNNGETVGCKEKLMTDALALLKEQEAEIRQLRLALDIAKGTCNGIRVEGR